MPVSYIVRLPDGVEYGPADLPTLAGWHKEGRLPAGSQVQTEGSDDWLPVAEVLRKPQPARPAAAPASGRPAAIIPKPAAKPSAAKIPASAAPRPAAEPSTAPDLSGPDEPARPRAARSARPGSSPVPKIPRAVLLVAAGLLLVVVLLGTLLAALSPWIARRRARLEVQGEALPDRRFADPSLGVIVEAPQGWLILRPETRLVAPSDAKLILAQPTVGAFAALRVESQPRLVAGEDASLDALVESWRLYRPKLQVLERGDQRLAKGQGRVLHASWDEAGEPMRGAAVVFHDGWNYFTLQAWAPAATASAFVSEFQALARGVGPAGALESRVDEAVRQVAVEAPELSRTAVRMLVQVRMSAGQPTDDLPETSVRVVNRGLLALSTAESAEMGKIYAQVWGPLPEAERNRLARYLEQVRAGRAIAPEEAKPLRQLIKAGILSLPEDVQARLQALNEKAIGAGLGRP
jgi:hypothetical protein